MTVRELLTQCLNDLGVLDAAEVMSAEDADLSLSYLNTWIDAMKAERLSIYTVTRTTWTIVSGTGTYTVGTGGDVNVSRPVFVDQINFQDTSVSPTLEYTLPKPLTEEAYQAIPQKSLTGTYPSTAYYNPTYPLGTIKFWMIPTSTTLQGVLYAPAAVDEVALSDTLSLPPGYRRMLRTNVAQELAAAFTRETPKEIARAAQMSKAVVKASNQRIVDLRFDRALAPIAPIWNIYTGC